MQPMPRKPAPNNGFSERFLSLLKEAGLTQPALAKRIGVDKTTVWHWAEGHNRPGAGSLSAVAKELGTSVNYLLGEKDEEGTPTAQDRVKTLRSLLGARMPDEQVSIPKLLRVAAGSAVYSPPDDSRAISVGRRAIEAIVGPVPQKEPQGVVFAADVRGDSMAPGLIDGDTLIVKRFVPSRRGPMIEDGRVYVLAPDGDGHVQVKRLLLVDGHQLLVVSDNQKFPPKAVDLRNAERVQHMIIGRVVKLIRDM